MHSEPPSADHLPAACGAISTALEQFQRGELTETQYLDGCIDVAMGHVQRRLSPARYQMIREVILEMLDTDPVLVEMKQRLLRSR